MASAQRWGGGQQSGPPSEAVTVTGTVVITNGMPSIKSGDVTYVIPGINRIVGLNEGLKEGAQITVEGMAITNPNDSNLKFVRASKLTLNGKGIEVLPPQERRYYQKGWYPPHGLKGHHSMKHPRHHMTPYDRNAPHERYAPPGRYGYPRRPPYPRHR